MTKEKQNEEFINMGSELYPVWAIMGTAQMPPEWARKLTPEEIAAHAAEKTKQEAEERERQHLEHPFYQDANEYREDVRKEQIIKGAHKYPTPFDPSEWTAVELLEHAMQENVDQGHYIYGLFQKIKEMQDEIEKKSQAVIENCELRRQLDRALELLKQEKRESKAAEKFAAVEIERLKAEKNDIWKEKEYMRREMNQLKEEMIENDRKLDEKEMRVEEVEQANLELRIELGKCEDQRKDYEKRLDRLQAYCNGLVAGVEARGKQ